MLKYLNDYKEPADIRKMTLIELKQFSKEIRSFLIQKVSKTGGHLASNLGVVELTLSLYNVFDFPKDKLIWDVGHQAYVHKMLSGRMDKFNTLRQFGGLSGFPKREESSFDVFETGHSSTSLSSACGIARGRDLLKEKYDVVAVIGDGALTGGMALEALNDIGYKKTRMVIVLNDNEMSIGKNVGGISTYLNTLRAAPGYNKFKEEFNSTLNKTNIGKGVVNSLNKIKGGIKQIVVPGMLFEDMGIKYFGPIDGHNIKEMSKVLGLAKKINGPVLIHVITKKGKGYEFAENNPNKFHGIGPFDYKSGEICSKSKLTYSKVFGDELIKLAEIDKSIVAITAAMTDGTGLSKFSSKFKERFFDVGIAEQHAVTMAAGMANCGLKPVFAVYSTFLQRAYDQVLHDVCMQKLPVVFAIDRAGIVGEDGETHQGVFDLSYLSHMPNMTIISPKCLEDLRAMLCWSLKQKHHAVAIRYPRGGDYENIDMTPIKEVVLGKWEVLNEEGNISLVATGKMVQHALLVRQKLDKLGIKAKVINACFIKPIDKELIKKLTQESEYIFTIEDNVIHGGLGTMVLEYVSTLKTHCNVKNLGFKDEFIPHGKVDLLYKLYGLDVDGIYNLILSTI